MWGLQPREKPSGISLFYYVNVGGAFHEQAFLDYERQIDKLMNEKKLNISNIDYAREMLKRYSYYSLISGYKEEFKDPSTSLYKSNACFEDIVSLYEFDENLRALFLRYIQKIEGYVKSLLSFYFCEKHGCY